jgi:hypothetical protein
MLEKGIETGLTFLACAEFSLFSQLVTRYEFFSIKVVPNIA